LAIVILPKRNEADLEDLPEEVRDSMKFVFVESVDQVLEAALEPAARKTKRKTKPVPDAHSEVVENA
jgi:ATP-dependent Lon protease